MVQLRATARSDTVRWDVLRSLGGGWRAQLLGNRHAQRVCLTGGGLQAESCARTIVAAACRSVAVSVVGRSLDRAMLFETPTMLGLCCNAGHSIGIEWFCHRTRGCRLSKHDVAALNHRRSFVPCPSPCVWSCSLNWATGFLHLQTTTAGADYAPSSRHSVSDG